MYFRVFNTVFFEILTQVSKTNQRTIGDDNGTIENFMNFLLLSYKKLYAYQVLTF